MTKLKDDHFQGKGMSQQPLAPEELAQIREMFGEISDRWPTITGFAKLVDATNVLYNVIRIGGPVGLTMLIAGAMAKFGGYI